MKEKLNKISKGMVILAVLLLVSVIFNVCLSWVLISDKQEEEKANRSIRKTTFATGKNSSFQRDYIVFRYGKNRCDRYRQLEKVTSGTYTLYGDNIYRLVMDGKEKEEIYLVYLGGDKVYLLQDGEAVKYEKIADDAYYYSVETPPDF